MGSICITLKKFRLFFKLCLVYVIVYLINDITRKKVNQPNREIHDRGLIKTVDISIIKVYLKFCIITICMGGFLWRCDDIEEFFDIEETTVFMFLCCFFFFALGWVQNDPWCLIQIHEVANKRTQLLQPTNMRLVFVINWSLWSWW